MTSQITRRTFLTQAAAAAAVAAAARPLAKVLGANDQIGVAVVGINGRGSSHIGEFRDMADTRVVALCDVDSNVLAARAKPFADEGQEVATYTDFRALLEDRRVDVVSIATPNHWHSLMTIWACQAGKDVYVEKPCSHNVFEGRKCVEAARKYGRIVQHGTQGRSSDGTARQIAAVRSGRYGRLLVSKGYCCKPRWSIGFKPFTPVPPHVDFDLWLGPAPDQFYHENLVHYNWHWFWDTGNGDMGNQGVHEMDIARWAIKDATLPKAVIGMGGRWVDEPGFKDQGQTPNMELSVFDFGGTLLVFETRGLVDKIPAFPRRVGNEFFMEGGVIRDSRFFPGGEGEGEPLADVDYELRPGGHFGNFINCVRSRRQEELNADILLGHYASALCHIGNISYRLGSDVPFAERPAALTASKVVSDSMLTVLENTRAIGVGEECTTYRLGSALEFDAATEQFVDSPSANMMLSRPYRRPFVVPDEV